MVFCFIVIIAVAIVYFIGLWIRQLFSAPRKDLTVSDLPAPPRAMSGHGALPVYGHTRLFCEHAGDVALLFPPDWLEMSIVPASWTRQLGECFAVFIWGQWRVAVKGPDRSKQIMSTAQLREGWSWTPPVALLGKSCLCFLQESDQESMQQLLQMPLQHEQILQYAPIFACIAEKCLSEILIGTFSKYASSSHVGSSVHQSTDSSWNGSDHRDNIPFDQENTPSARKDHGTLKVKWEALRSYTFDLIDGPILGMNHWTGKETGSHKNVPSVDRESEKIPMRARMLMYMERMKAGLDVIKTTFGPEWMYIWLMNEYGRALNARMHIERIFQRHVAEKSALVPVRHQPGHSYHEPSTRPIPFLTFKNNLMRSNEDIFGSGNYLCAPPQPQGLPSRPRCKTCPSILPQDFTNECQYSEPTKQLLTRPSSEQDLPLSKECALTSTPKHTNRKQPIFASSLPISSPLDNTPHRQNLSELKASKRLRALSESDAIQLAQSTESIDMMKNVLSTPPRLHPTNSGFETPDDVRERPEVQQQLPQPSDTSRAETYTPISLLDCLLCQEDETGNGMSQAVVTEICIVLWMMLDSGNAWTAMALNLLSRDDDACELVHREIDALLSIYGQRDLFTPDAMNKMQYLDALLFESIRLCPPFLGGLKVTSKTVELESDGVQVPKDSHVFFCQATEHDFDIRQALGKRPQDLGSSYPSVDLFGFLPFRGLEVPLMVLQCKVFLLVVLKDHTPSATRKKILFRRVRAASQRIMNSPMMKKLKNMDADETIGSPHPTHSELPVTSSVQNGRMVEDETIPTDANVSQTTISKIEARQAMQWFTKIPYPEPRASIGLKERVQLIDDLI